MNNANNSGRVYRPYRKASEYLGHSQKPAISSGQKSSLELDNEALQQKVMLLTRKLEHAEAEYMQSREYLESQLDVALVKFNKVTDQYKKLQSSYVALQTNNRELENKVSKINRLEDEKSSMVKEINDLTRKVTDSRSSLLKSQEENERLRKDCNLAVQLLKCNQSSYQTTKPAQVPQELQDRVNDYQVQLHDYNEYINPYMDGDSDSDNEDPYHRRPPAHNQPQMTNGMSTDFLAQVLQKPENVHMNLEPSDYIRDPQLTSTYKARYTEKKLIRPDYGKDRNDAEPRHHQQHHPRPPHDQTSASDASSPWEMNPQASVPPPSADPSPWERRAMPSSAMATEDDGPSAGAYGAYAVGSRRRQARSDPRMRAEMSSTRLDRIPPPRKQEQRERFHVPSPLPKPQEGGFRVPTPPSSPDDIEFRRPAESSDAYIASNFFSRTIAPASSSSLSSSKSSSRKSSPLKVRGKERASKAETSSLLDQENSGEEEDDHRQKSPSKSYLTPGVVEGNSLLREEEEDDFERVYEAQEINLEWDSSVDKLDGPELVEEVDAAENVAPPTSSKEPQSNLLLSYNEESSPALEQKPLPSDLLPADVADLLADTTLTDSDAIPSKEQTPSDPGSSGQLLSEIVHGHPLFQDFLLTTAPPPPQQFATTEEPDPSSLYKLVHEEPPEQVLGLPNRVDEQILVIDVDQELPPQGDLQVEEESSENRRRASFEEARNHGSVMD